jgi:hypothetical protein
LKYRFVAFDREQTNAEFLQVPYPDYAILAQAMASYQELGSDSTRAIVNKYEGNIWRLKPNGSSSGRCLFLRTGVRSKGVEDLLVLVVYKKEGQRVPTRVLARALERAKEWKDG